MCGYLLTEAELKMFTANTPYIRRSVILHVVQYPSLKPKETELERMARESASRERGRELAAKANTLYMPMDNGEYLYYHHPTGRFVTLDWHGMDYNTIVLTKEQMALAREAFKKRWPDDRYGTAFFDLETNTFPS